MYKIHVCDSKEVREVERGAAVPLRLPTRGWATLAVSRLFAQSVAAHGETVPDANTVILNHFNGAMGTAVAQAWLVWARTRAFSFFHRPGRATTASEPAYMEMS